MRSPARTSHDRFARSSGFRRRRALLALAAGTLILAAGCSGGSSSGSNDSTTTSTGPAAAEVPVYVDSAAPITVAIGKEFSIMLPADPGSGWRWVLAPIDNTRLIALGSRFSDDPDLLSKAQTATTTTTTIARSGNATTSTTETTIPAVLPLVQIISFVGRAAGPAALSFSYNQIAGAPQAENRVVTFSVQVVPETPTTTAAPTTTTAPTTSTTR